MNNKKSKASSAKENKMKKELDQLGMYEEGMQFEEMNELLQAIKSSENDVQRSGSTSSLDADAVESPIHSPHSPEYDPPRSQSYSKTLQLSPEETKLNKVLNITGAKKIVDSDNFNNYPLLKNAIGTTLSISQNNLNHQSTSSQNATKAKPHIDMWEIDPLDCKTVDIPLKPLRQSSTLSSRPSFEFINGFPQIPQEILANMNRRLQETADNWIKKNNHSTKTEFRWGAPIKVGIANGSLDKYPFRIRSAPPPTPEPRVEVVEAQVTMSTSGIDRSRLQRAVTTKPRTLDKDMYKFDENDSDEDFEVEQKKSKIDAFSNKPPLKRKGIGPAAHTSLTKTTVPKKDNAVSDEEWQSSRSPKTQVKLRGASPEYDVPVTSNEYPRRISPPHPSKPKPKKPRCRKPTEKSQQNLLSIIKITPAKPSATDVEKMDTIESPRRPTGNLNEDEIANALNSGEESESEEVKSSFPENNRLDLSISKLRAKNEEKKAQEQQLAKEMIDRAEQQNVVKKRRMEQRIKENKQKVLAEEAAEKKKKEKEKKYRSALDRPKINLDDVRIELKSDNEMLRPAEITIPWDPKADCIALASTRNETRNIDQFMRQGSKVGCPICSRLFHPDEITNHAAICEEFGVNNHVEQDIEELVEKSCSLNILECHICGKFRTREGNLFEVHVNECKENIAQSSGRESLTTVPDSPIRSFKPISGVDNPEVYKNQFQLKKPSGKTPNKGNRKRKLT